MSAKQEILDRVRTALADVPDVPAAEDVPDAVVTGLQATGGTSVVVPPGLEPAWVEAMGAAGVRVCAEPEGRPLSSADLNDVAAVVTAAAVGIAETGTIVLDHGLDQGRRALSLVPDRHVCVVRADQVVSAVAEAVTLLKPAVLAGRPLTWISGPSATSDIELSRIEGVHGPRTLYVVIAG